jgi:hypothetical protein
MMDVVRRIVVGIAGVVLVALALELFAPKAVHAVVSTLVTVSNTSGNPVPTMAVDTRNVNVVNTPNVNVNTLPAVQLSGTPSVNINSMPPVNASVTGNVPVSNPLDGSGNPIPLVTQSPVSAANAFDTINSCQVPSGKFVCGGIAYTVPAGKMAVIQSASSSCQLDAGENMTEIDITYTSPSGASEAAYMQPGPLLAHFSGDFVSLSQERLTAYATGGSSGAAINFLFEMNGSIGAGCFFQLAGYLVNQ